MEPETNRDKYVLSKVLLIVSLIINVIFGLNFAFKAINSPENRQGVLKDDVTVIIPKDGSSTTESISITFPKGMVVQDASPRGYYGIIATEPYRFQITLISDGGELVDYSVDRNKYIYFSSWYAATINKIK